MTTPKQTDRAALQERLTQLQDHLGALMPEHFAVTLADFAEAEAAKLKADVAAFAQAANWTDATPRAAAGPRARMMLEAFKERLHWPAVVAAMASPELDAMRERVLPLEREIEATKAGIAEIDAEANTIRQRLADELAAAEAAALESKNVLKLRAQLAALS